MSLHNISAGSGIQLPSNSLSRAMHALNAQTMWRRLALAGLVLTS
jgi:hypothetical protein